MPRPPIPTWFFVLVVVRDGDRFLVIREAKHQQHWYLPAGRVEPGETLVEAAHRETLEEAGVPIILEGLLKILHTPYADCARIRVLFLARPADATPPKSVPDEQSLEARWVTLDELASLPLRSLELPALFAWSLAAPVHSLELLGQEE